LAVLTNAEGSFGADPSDPGVAIPGEAVTGMGELQPRSRVYAEETRLMWPRLVRRDEWRLASSEARERVVWWRRRGITVRAQLYRGMRGMATTAEM
jgi:hypothetical protein